jgi:hypothetical protein
MKSEERAGQTIRPLVQQTALQKGHSALQLLLQMTRRTALPEHKASLENKSRALASGDCSTIYQAHSSCNSVLNIEKNI